MSDGVNEPNPTLDTGNNPPAEAQKTEQHVPYERFKEVNDKYKDLESKWKEQEAKEQERAKKKQEAEQARLEKEGQFEKASEGYKARIAELELYEAEAKEARETLKVMLDAKLKIVPEDVKELLEGRTPAQQLAFIAKHEERWVKPTPPDINAGNNGGRTTTKTDDEKARLAALYGVKPEFIE